MTIFYHFSPMCYPPNVTWHFVFVKCMLHMIFSYASMNKLIYSFGKDNLCLRTLFFFEKEIHERLEIVVNFSSGI